MVYNRRNKITANYRKSGNYQITSYSTLDIVAAAVIAYRKNNKKVERDTFTANNEAGVKQTITSNKALALGILKNFPDQITQADRDEAQAIIQSIQGTVTMGLLSGERVSDFTKELAKEFENEVSTEYKVGLLAYAPDVYEGTKQRADIEEKTASAMYTSEALGKVGDRVRVNFTLITKKYVQSISCFSATGTDEKGNLVQFLTGKEELCQSQEIEGKIKTVGISQYHHSAIVTGLNYVKTTK